MTYKLDDKDWQILDVLKENSDWPTRKIAKKTRLPITTVHNRIKKLKADGVIEKFTVKLNSQKIDRNFLAYVHVETDLERLKDHKKNLHSLSKDLRKFDFVERADNVTGQASIVMLVRAKDIHEFDTILLEKIQMVEGVKRTRTDIVLRENK